MKNVPFLIVGLLIGIGFIYAIFRYLPLGTAIAITGACLATVRSDNNKIDFIGATGGWVFLGGVIYSFIKSGWVVGLLSVVAGFVAYRFAKQRK